jgi:hypothetical protein
MGVLKSVEPTGFLAFARAFAGTNWADVDRRIIQNCPHGRGRVLSSAAWLRLYYQWGGEPVDYRDRLVTTKPTYGGLRWWFICPLARRDSGPPRRVAKLYLPPGSRYFGSRNGHGLTYTMPGERKVSRALPALAAEMGTAESMVQAALNRCEVAAQWRRLAEDAEVDARFRQR